MITIVLCVIKGARTIRLVASPKAVKWITGKAIQTKCTFLCSNSGSRTHHNRCCRGRKLGKEKEPYQKGCWKGKRKGTLQCPMLGGGEEKWRGGDEKKEGEKDGRVPPLSLGVEVGKKESSGELRHRFPVVDGEKIK